MLRTCFYVACIAIIFAVRSSDAANCTSTQFMQDVDKATLAAANIIAEDYATSTKAEIIAKIRKELDPNIIDVSLNITQTADQVSVAYKLIFACNETVITYLPDGTQKITQVTTTVDQDKVKKTVQAG